MNKIVFVTKNATYDLANSVNRTQSQLQASLLKGNNTIDSILQNVDGNSVIRVTNENGDLIQQYNGYSKLFALSVHTGETDDKNIVSVEFINTDLQSQIGEIMNSVDDLAQAQTALSETQSAQADQITALDDSQATQDIAIEDLGQAVSDLVEE